MPRLREQAYKSYNIDGLMDDEDLSDQKWSEQHPGIRIVNPLKEFCVDNINFEGEREELARLDAELNQQLCQRS